MGRHILYRIKKEEMPVVRSLGKKLLPFVLAVVAGVLLHFVYGWFPNPVTALISPVRESLWEHGKLLFYPLLAAAVFTTGKDGGDRRGSWYLSILITFAAMLAVGYGYYVVLGGETPGAGVVIYVLLMALAFVLGRVLDRPEVQKRSELLRWCILLLWAMILLFTFLPPENILFADLTGAHMWYQLPC